MVQQPLQTNRGTDKLTNKRGQSCVYHNVVGLVISQEVSVGLEGLAGVWWVGGAKGGHHTNNTLHCTALHSTKLPILINTAHFTPLHCISLHLTVLHFTELHYTALGCTTCTALHCCTTFHFTAPECHALQ